MEYLSTGTGTDNIAIGYNALVRVTSNNSSYYEEGWEDIDHWGDLPEDHEYDDEYECENGYSRYGCKQDCLNCRHYKEFYWEKLEAAMEEVALDDDLFII